MHILFIVDSIPFPVLGGASLRNYNLLRRLAVDHEVSLVAFARNAEQAEGTQHMRGFCSSVDCVDLRAKGAFSDLPNLIRYALRGAPPDLRFYASDALAGIISRLLIEHQFDVIHIDQIYMGLYLDNIPGRDHKRTLWVLHDVDYVKYRRILQLEPNRVRKFRLWLNAQLLCIWEPRYAARFRRCITVSEMDKQLLLGKNPNINIEVIPNGVDTSALVSLPDSSARPSLIFVGNMAYLPCVDAVQYFCEQILPMIREAIPEVEFWIVGRDPPDHIQRLNGNGIHVTGRVKDVQPFYEQSTVCVVPLRAGGGTRLKILEAIALGRPVISTSIGCEGLDLADNEQIIIADDPASFAHKSVQLLTDPSLRKRIARNGRQVVESRYNWDAITKKLVEVYREVAGP